MSDEPQEVEVKTLDGVLEEVETSGTPMSHTTSMVYTAAIMDAAQGDDTYDPEQAAESSPPWDEEELRDACEELVELGHFDREDDVYRLVSEE